MFWYNFTSQSIADPTMAPVVREDISIPCTLHASLSTALDACTRNSPLNLAGDSLVMRFRSYYEYIGSIKRCGNSKIIKSDYLERI
ncbi:MAG: hypothetical protein M3M87_04295 [Thermoproteota archaeon]|nr:hypothetical protein [Thermoproteota archaeon]